MLGLRSQASSAAPKELLEPDASLFLREQLIIELAALVTVDEAVTWAQRSLPAKNTLTSADADVIEQAFSGRKCILWNE